MTRRPYFTRQPASLILVGLALLLTFGLTFFGRVQFAKADNCGLIANPAADRQARSSSNDTIIIQDINTARQAEGLPVLPKAVSYYANLAVSNPEALILELFNEERSARGISTFSQNDLVLAQVAENHSKIFVDYDLFAHNTAVDGTASNRITSAPGISGKSSGWGEIIAGAYAASWHVFGWMYDDSSSAWGHRKAILGCYSHVGIGTAIGGAYGKYTTADFIKSNGSYVPPTSVDTTPPQITGVSTKFTSNGGTANAVISVNASDSGSGMRDAVFFRLPNDFSGSVAPKGTAVGNTFTYTFTNQSAGNFTVAVLVFDKNNNYYRQDFTVIDMTVPPSNLTATAVSPSQINLNWQDNSANEDHFEIDLSTDGVNFTPLVAVGANVTNYSVTALNPNTKYYFRVIAGVAAGGTGTSNVASATTLQPIPNAPASLAANTISSNQINLNWADLSDNETSFELQQSSDGVNFTGVAANPLPPNTKAYTATGLTADTAYYFRVRAVNGSYNSSYSNIANARTLPNPPTTPANLQVTAVSAVQLNLSWTDNASNETGFYLEYRPANGIYQPLTNLNPDTTSYSMIGLNPSTQYFFRVRAFNLGGNSAFAAENNATTLAVNPQLVVSSPTDEGAASETTAGKLSYALKNAASGDIISFSVPTVTLSQTLATVPRGVIIYGGACGTPRVTLQGTAGVSGLTINGATLMNLTLQGFTGKQLTILRDPIGYTNYLRCVKINQS